MIKIELKFQVYQDIVNNFINQKNDFQPTILMPANGEILAELRDRPTSNNSPFYNSPDQRGTIINVRAALPQGYNEQLSMEKW